MIGRSASRMLQSLARCPAVWPACGNTASSLRQRTQQCSQSFGNSLQGSLGLLSWLCKFSRRANTTSQQPAILLPSTSQQCSHLQPSAFNFVHRHSHAQVSPGARGGRKADRRSGGAERRKLEERKSASASPHDHEPARQPPSSTSRLLRTSSSEYEHMHARHRQPAQRLPAAAADTKPPRQHRRKRGPRRPQGEDHRQASAAAAASIVPGLQQRRPRSCLLYTSPSPRDRTRSRMPSSA